MGKSRSIGIKTGVIHKWKKLYYLLLLLLFNLDVALDHERIHCSFMTYLLPGSLLHYKGEGEKRSLF